MIINPVGLVLAGCLALFLHGAFGIEYDIAIPVAVAAPYVLQWLLSGLLVVAESSERSYDRTSFAKKRRQKKMDVARERMRARRDRS